LAATTTDLMRTENTRRQIIRVCVRPVMAHLAKENEGGLGWQAAIIAETCQKQGYCGAHVFDVLGTHAH
jgi:hypothetical protein